MTKQTLHRSNRAFTQACEVLVGGVNSPVRAFKAVGGTPVFIERGKGCRLYDVDGNAYIDYVLSWGPLILGHAHPLIVERVNDVMKRGASFGAPTTLETELARLVVEALPSVDLVRFVNSGTEATMSALRLARAFTGRPVVCKFAGCYHGHHDALLVAGGSGMVTLGAPSSPGVTTGAAADTLVLRYNDPDSVREAFAENPERVAAIIVEPVAGNMGVVPPKEGFLKCLRDECTKHGALLIFDEVMTGFRVAYGGAQEAYGITPDLTTLGKVLGGGFPVGAYGGRGEIMQRISPMGDVYQAGTLSGNPVAMAAGIETLKILRGGNLYRQLERASAQLAERLSAEARAAGARTYHTRVGAMQGMFFLPDDLDEIHDWDNAARADTAMYARFFSEMLARGVYLAPSQYEAMFLSAMHSEQDIEDTAGFAGEALRAIREGDCRR